MIPRGEHMKEHKLLSNYHHTQTNEIILKLSKFPLSSIVYTTLAQLLNGSVSETKHWSRTVVNEIYDLRTQKKSTRSSHTSTETKKLQTIR